VEDREQGTGNREQGIGNRNILAITNYQLPIPSFLR